MLEDAIAKHRLGRLDEAALVYQEFTEIRPELAEPWHLLGVVKLQRGTPQEAERYFREALKRDGGHVKCLSNLGAALYQLNRLEEAEVELSEALQLNPDHVDALYNLGNVLIGLSRHDEALAHYLQILRLNPRHAKAQTNIAVLYSKRRDHTQAVAHLERALEIIPGDFTCLINLAWSAERLNRVDQARAAAAEALRQQPGDAQANLIAAMIDLRLKKPEQALERLEITSASALEKQDRAYAYFTKGRAHEELKQNDAAYTAFSTGNAIELELAQESGIDPNRYLARLDDAHSRLDVGPVEPGGVVASPGEPIAPVFFVGFPRSGTTLFEQMIASHPNVVTTNEISPLIRVLMKVDLTSSANVLDENTRQELQAQFWQEARNIVGEIDGRLMIDSSPLNIRLLDFAARLFPKAKVLVAIRDPRDVCLSCFMQQFNRTEELANFTSLEGTAEVYGKLMGLWGRQKNLIDLPWMEFRYEDLVADMEGVIRSVLTFLDLQWEDGILTYQNKALNGHIATPSYRQVGDVLHDRACGRWRRYEKRLVPIMERLSPFVEAYGYDK